MTINEANINKNDIADRAVDAICDGFAHHGFITDASTDERIWEAVWERLQDVELTPLR